MAKHSRRDIFVANRIGHFTEETLCYPLSLHQRHRGKCHPVNRITNRVNAWFGGTEAAVYLNCTVVTECYGSVFQPEILRQRSATGGRHDLLDFNIALRVKN